MKAEVVPWQATLARGVLADMVKHAGIVFAPLEETALITDSASSKPAEVGVAGGGDVVH